MSKIYNTKDIKITKFQSLLDMYDGKYNIDLPFVLLNHLEWDPIKTILCLSLIRGKMTPENLYNKCKPYMSASVSGNKYIINFTDYIIILLRHGLVLSFADQKDLYNHIMMFDNYVLMRIAIEKIFIYYYVYDYGNKKGIPIGILKFFKERGISDIMEDAIQSIEEDINYSHHISDVLMLLNYKSKKIHIKTEKCISNIVSCRSDKYYSATDNITMGGYLYESIDFLTTAIICCNMQYIKLVENKKLENVSFPQEFVAKYFDVLSLISPNRSLLREYSKPLYFICRSFNTIPRDYFTHSNVSDKYIKLYQTPVWMSNPSLIQYYKKSFNLISHTDEEVLNIIKYLYDKITSNKLYIKEILKENKERCDMISSLLCKPYIPVFKNNIVKGDSLDDNSMIYGPNSIGIYVTDKKYYYTNDSEKNYIITKRKNPYTGENAVFDSLYCNVLSYSDISSFDYSLKTMLKELYKGKHLDKEDVKYKEKLNISPIMKLFYLLFDKGCDINDVYSYIPWDSVYERHCYVNQIDPMFSGDEMLNYLAEFYCKSPNVLFNIIEISMSTKRHVQIPILYNINGF